MRTNSSRPSIVGLIAALALAACQGTPATPPTQTPVNPKDTFATPGAPTPFLPTMTPVPSPTLRPTATAVPSTAVPATVAPPTLAPTKGATPTPTPVIVNGQPKMWWVDQMVKQADGSFMAPEVVRQTIRDFVAEHNANRTLVPGQNPAKTAKDYYERNPATAERFYFGDLRRIVATTPSPQVQLIASGTATAVDVRAFGSDGMTAHVLVDFTTVKSSVFSTQDWSLIDASYVSPNAAQLWKVHFDVADGRWKYEELILTQPR